jgi:uncharacterized membrane protein YkgB
LKSADIVLLISNDNAVDFLYDSEQNLSELMKSQFKNLVEVMSYLKEENQKSASFLVGYVTKNRKILILDDPETHQNFLTQ